MTSGQSHFLFVWMCCIYIAYIVVDMEAGAVLPLGVLKTDPACWYSGSPYKAVSGSHHSDDGPNPNILTVDSDHDWRRK